LLDLGYRIRPQVQVGGYAIDFVVEGSDDRRLAVELDGDKYHGPSRWADDVRRQRALERLGWTFWRCWGSAWVSDQEGSITDLRTTLGRLGIEPIGMGETGGVFTEHIEVRAVAPAEPVIEESFTVDQTSAQPAFQFGQAVAKRSLSRRDRSIVQQELLPGFSASQSDGPAPVTTGPIVEPATEDASSRSRAELASEPVIDQHVEDSGVIFADLDSIVVEVGDLVFLRYDDQPDRSLSVRLSDNENNPRDGIVHMGQPLGAAINGASLDEQVTVKIGDRTRTAVIEKIEKLRPVAPLPAPIFGHPAHGARIFPK